MASQQQQQQQPSDMSESIDIPSPTTTTSPNDIQVSTVLILMTGGTICSVKSSSGLVPAGNFLESCMAPRPSFNDGSPPTTLDIISCDSYNTPTTTPHKSLTTPISEYNRRIRYTVHEFSPLLDSSAVDGSVWLQLVNLIYLNYEHFDGFVVLHGTDTMAYSASALSFLLQDLGKPVVLTGSQRPMGELQNDGVDNLLGSLMVAGHFCVPEVTLYFNYKLFRGNRATKISATAYDAFASPNLPPLATITATGIHVRWDLIQPLDPSRTFHPPLTLNLSTAHVAFVRIFPGITPSLIRTILAESTKTRRGLVLESFGAGNIPNTNSSALGEPGLIDVLAEAVQRGVVVVNITQCLNGNVSPLYAPAVKLAEAGVLLGYDMTGEAALTKLSYLLATTGEGDGGGRAGREGGDGLKEVKRLMAVSLRGELTRGKEVWFGKGHPPSGVGARSRL